jgi:hypothetical protein
MHNNTHLKLFQSKNSNKYSATKTKKNYALSRKPNNIAGEKNTTTHEKEKEEMYSPEFIERRCLCIFFFFK